MGFEEHRAAWAYRLADLHEYAQTGTAAGIDAYEAEAVLALAGGKMAFLASWALIRRDTAGTEREARAILRECIYAIEPPGPRPVRRDAPC